MPLTLPPDHLFEASFTFNPRNRLRYARIPARGYFGAYLQSTFYVRDLTEQSQTKYSCTNIGTIPKNMPTNFEFTG